MLARLTGARSRPSSAWFSSSSWKARFKASMEAKVNVTHRMLGARSTAATAVGSRPKLKTIKTSTVNTTAERIAVRDRNSTRRSLRTKCHAWRRILPTGHRPPVRVGDLRRAAPAAGREVYEPARPHERHVGRELGPLFDVVGDQDGDAASRSMPGQQPAQLLGRRAVEPREGLVEQQHARIVDQGARDRDALHETPRQLAYEPVLVRLQTELEHQIVFALEIVGLGYVVQRRPESQVLRDRELSVELRLVTDPPDGAPATLDPGAPRAGLDQPGESLEEGGLPCAVGTEHGQGLSWVQRE